MRLVVVVAVAAVVVLAEAVGRDLAGWAGLALDRAVSVSVLPADTASLILLVNRVTRNAVPSVGLPWYGHRASMRVVCLVDNAVQPGSPFWGEHGLAFWIETEAGGVLFDTGQSGTVLLHNMDLLRIPVADLRALALSHGHYDHVGGLSSLFSRLESEVPAYASPDFFRSRYSRRPGGVEYIGPSLTESEIRARLDVRLSPEPQEVVPGMWTTGEVDVRPEPEGRSANHLVRDKAEWIPDPYRDDMSLVIEVSSGLILLCGCCHAGLLNTVYHVERTFQRSIVGIAGGTHLASSDIAYLRHVGAVLQALPSLRWVAPSHCSGHTAFCELRQMLGHDVVRPCPVGTVIDWEEDL